jgi:hypothetical protein
VTGVQTCALPISTAEAESIVLADGLSEQADARARTLPETRSSKPSPAVKKAPGRTTGTNLPAQSRARTTNPRAAAEKRPVRATADDTPAPAPAHTPEQTPAATPALDTPAKPTRSGSSMLVWVAVPLLAIIAVGGYIWWDLYTEKLRAQQLSDDPSATQPIANLPTGPERSREVKVKPDVAPPPPPSTADDDLAGIAKSKKPPPAVAKPTVSPGESALRKLEGDLNQLDANVARKFTLKVSALRSELKAHENDTTYLATFQAKVNAVHDEVKVELQKQ